VGSVALALAEYGVVPPLWGAAGTEEVPSWRSAHIRPIKAKNSVEKLVLSRKRPGVAVKRGKCEEDMEGI